MGFTERANEVRKRIPFAYWLAYDAVTTPFILWGLFSLSCWFVIPLAFLLVAVFFDVNEAIVKWSERKDDGHSSSTHQPEVRP